MDTESPSLLESRRFKVHAKHFIEMLDTALMMLEAKQLESNMKSLGKMHAAYGVKANYFPIMGEALIYTLKQCLPPEEFSAAAETAWSVVYDRMSNQMIEAMRDAK